MSDHPRFLRAAPSVTVAAAMIVGVVGLSAPELAFAENTITCESQNGQTNRCRVDTRGGVALVTQLSKAGCYQGNTWGYDNRFIWVSNGCRAVFRLGSTEHRSSHDSDAAAAAVAGIALLALGAAAAHKAHEDDSRDRYDDYDSYRSYGNDRDYNRRYDDYREHQRIDTVSCASENNRYHYCRAPVRNGHVRIVRQHSNSSCRFHEDWGYNRSGVWVENGCRATFEIERY
ncbi:MAG: DUF3011 domain-containing protein [Gammaproteobacteria bacterium]